MVLEDSPIKLMKSVKTDDEIWKEEYMANIDYISMMAGIELDE